MSLPSKSGLHQAIGEAIESYATAEAEIAHLLGALLKIEDAEAFAILFAVQNVRSRNELFGHLLVLRLGDGIRKYWASCSKFLLTLGQFRNAIAHWHPYYNLYQNDKRSPLYVPAVGHPVPGHKLAALEAGDFPPFIIDRKAIVLELDDLTDVVIRGLLPLPEKFQKPITRRNRAVLQPLQRPTEQQPRRSPSRQSESKKGPKPSAKQRRQRALSAAKKKPS